VVQVDDLLRVAGDCRADSVAADYSAPADCPAEADSPQGCFLPADCPGDFRLPEVAAAVPEEQ
jgi:hypothetical protein